MTLAVLESQACGIIKEASRIVGEALGRATKANNITIVPCDTRTMTRNVMIVSCNMAKTACIMARKACIMMRKACTITRKACIMEMKAHNQHHEEDS